MTGAMTHRDLLPLYRRAWMLVAPSRVLANGRRDGIPNVVVEAMAMGVACVGTRAAGLEEAIVPGETGALCAPGDPDGLADAIASLLEAPAELDRMSAAARARALRLFDFDRGIERLIELFGFETADARAGRRLEGGMKLRVMHVIEAMHTGRRRVAGDRARPARRRRRRVGGLRDQPRRSGARGGPGARRARPRARRRQRAGGGRAGRGSRR